ncbi:ImmA/IrrE family metallo-endopeptidase [Achromobacter xylosoxidans]|uniref:ImmA/IrrE family metallo-endopeptidase n=1 Tax=Alcaligenes xylosoxydans xylosoxydans TaxID=85698 RepID=UPI0019057D13|nr:ImmA/IrrE family metallo-endopeptidase [Achromobacter xylosoxidans]MBK1979152.1 ImmA/IrrE family metallo-endopeptidase [Achromobacter xylosoxidans]
MKPSSATITTPGQRISQLLDDRGWTKRVLAVVLGIDEASISRIIADKKPLTPNLALGLEDVFGLPAESFLEVQAKYDIAVARLSTPADPTRASRAKLFGNFPVAEMIKRGWIHADSLKDTEQVEAELLRFFDAESSIEVEELPHAAKKTDALSHTSGAQLAWVYRVKKIASEMLVPKYNELSGRRAIKELASLLRSKEEVRKVPRVLAENGIRFLIVEALPSTKIDGVCLWLNDHSPVVAMSMRFDRIDNFWFVLRHELEHVLRGDGKKSPILEVDLDGKSNSADAAIEAMEQAANDAAAEFCVPRKQLEAFIARKAPFFPDRDIQGFATTLGVHPGLVAGRLQHQTGRYDRFRTYLEKVRHIVAPSSIVDGWGDFVPVDD